MSLLSLVQFPVIRCYLDSLVAEQGVSPGHGVLNADDEHVRWKLFVQDFDGGTAGAVGFFAGSVPGLRNRSAADLILIYFNSKEPLQFLP